MTKMITFGEDEYLAKVRESGNSVVVSIPKEVRESLNIQGGDHVHVNVSQVREEDFERMKLKTKAGRNFDYTAQAELWFGDEKVAEISSLKYSYWQNAIKGYHSSEKGELMKDENLDSITTPYRGVILEAEFSGEFLENYKDQLLSSILQGNALKLVIKEEDGDIEVESVELNEYLPEIDLEREEPYLEAKEFRGHREEYGESD